MTDVGNAQQDKSRHTRLGTPGEQQRHSPERKAQGQIEIEETNMKRPAVGQHRETRQHEPGPRPGRGAGQLEGAPKENQHAKRNRNPLRCLRAETVLQAAQDQVEQNVGPHSGDKSDRGISQFDLPGQPGVINMTAEITGLDSLPKARDQQGRRDQCGPDNTGTL